MKKSKDYTLHLIVFILGFFALMEYGCQQSFKQDNEPANKLNGYSLQVDGSDSILRYTIYDGSRFVGNVKSDKLDSLIISDNE